MKLLGHESPKMTMHYVEVSLLDVEHEFQLAGNNPATSYLLPKAHRPLLLPRTWLAYSVRSTPFNTYSKCSVARFPQARIAASSNASPIASPKSLPKPENSIHHRCGTFGRD